jgi:hypothetical protein
MLALRAIRTVLALLAVVLIGSCDSGPRTGEVSGKVSYDGKLLETGSIRLFPTDGTTPTAGGVIKDGKYAVAKVSVGKYKVTISGSQIVGQKKLYDTPNSPTAPITVDPLPEKYKDWSKTELTLDVKPGPNEKNWDLAK